ncbi:phosphatidate cytidylyltransferase [Desulfolithobacter sp.]
MGRVLPGIGLLVVWVLLLFGVPGPLFHLVMVALVFTGLYEYFRMVLPGQTRGELLGSLAVAGLPVLATVIATPAALLAGLTGGLLGTVLLVLRRYSRLDDVLAFFSLSTLALAYISFCGAHLVLIRFLDNGAGWLLLLVAITAGSDTGAYYAGRAFGRRKLCPAISPGKTVAGALGGIVAGSLAAVLVGSVALPEVSLVRVALLGPLLVMVGIMGDLVESVIKRSSGVKDSGTILAGHGGLLDRIDSLLLTAPVFYLLLTCGVLA